MHHSLCRLPIMNYLFFLSGEKLFICKLHEVTLGSTETRLTQEVSAQGSLL